MKSFNLEGKRSQRGSEGRASNLMTHAGLISSFNLPLLTERRTKFSVKRKFAQEYSSKVDQHFRSNPSIQAASLPQPATSPRKKSSTSTKTLVTSISKQTSLVQSHRINTEGREVKREFGEPDVLETEEAKKVRLENERADKLMQMRLQKKKFDYLRQAFGENGKSKTRKNAAVGDFLRESERLDGRIDHIERDRPSLRLSLPEGRRPLIRQRQESRGLLLRDHQGETRVPRKFQLS
jgi:hypothetical protein